MQNSGIQRLAHLDGLRGLAALVVVLHHAVLVFYPALFTGSIRHAHTASGIEVLISATPLNILYNGTFCVSIFFVLSGYVLSWRFFNDGNYEGLMSSAARRYFRLVLPVACSVIIAHGCMKLSLFWNQQAVPYTTSAWLGTWWNFTPDLFDMLEQAFFGSLFNNEFSYNNVIWIVTYEMYGSLLVFSFLALFGRLRGRYVAYAAACLLMYKTYYLAFLFGVVLSDLHNGPVNHLDKVGKHAVSVILLLTVGLFLGSYPPGRETMNETIYRFIRLDLDMRFPFILHHEMGAFFVLAAVLSSARLQSLLASRPLLSLGSVSFSLYLTHLIVLFTVSSFLFVRLLNTMSYGWAFLVTMLVSAPVILIVAHALSRYVDARGIQFSHYVYRKIFQGAGSASISP